METTDHGKLLEELEQLELRARMLLAEHRHVVDTIRDMQRQLDAAHGSADSARHLAAR